jgi:hypothetical protein
MKLEALLWAASDRKKWFLMFCRNVEDSELVLKAPMLEAEAKGDFMYTKCLLFYPIKNNKLS